MMNDGNHPLFLLEKLFGKNSDAIIKNFHKLQKGLTQTCIKKTVTEMVSSCIYQISDVVQTNSATAEESAAASEELYGQSQLLKNRVSRFKLHANN